MARIVKAAVVVLVVVLGGGCGFMCVAAEDATKCYPDIKIQKTEEKKNYP